MEGQKQTLLRSLSYNDIKKRRMIRSNSRGRLTTHLSKPQLQVNFNAPNTSRQNAEPDQLDNFVSDLKKLVKVYEGRKTKTA